MEKVTVKENFIKKKKKKTITTIKRLGRGTEQFCEKKKNIAFISLSWETLELLHRKNQPSEAKNTNLFKKHKSCSLASNISASSSAIFRTVSLLLFIFYFLFLFSITELRV
jgi:hypothetical protein